MRSGRSLSCNCGVRIRVTDIRDHSVQELELAPDSRDLPGWQSGVAGWSIGPKGSGAPIELDEPLDGCSLGVFAFSYHVLLWGRAKEPPEVWSFPQDKPTASLVPFDPKRWLLIDRQELGRVAMGGGDVRLRFDQSPMRFGNYIFESLPEISVAKDCCAFCNEPLRSYFRVGSQQACTACTQKFRKEMDAKLAVYYRRALAAGIVLAMVGGAIHSVLVASARVNFGSTLIGVLVGMAMRIGSKESAGIRHRLTAVVLTLTAGSLPWWLGLLPVGGMSVVYVAGGMLAAWILSARNARTEIHGPFQSKTA